MYKIMLAEDEALVRENMIQNIDWEQYGFRMACACENGQEAIDQLPAVLPNVVITDICMPLVDGLELARHIQTHYPSIFVVILTGYNEFDYAQRAVRLHVHDFVLKPVVPSEFCAMLSRLAAELDERSSRRDDMRNLYNRAQQAEGALRNMLFRRLLREQPPAAQLREDAARAGLAFDCEAYGVLAADAADAASSPSARAALQLLDAAQATAVKYPHCVSALIDDRYAVLLLGGRTQAEIAERTLDAGNMLLSAALRVCRPPVQIGVGGCCADPSGLHRCAVEAFHALGYGFSLERSLVVDQRAATAERKITAADPLPSERAILQAVQARGFPKAQELLAGLFGEMRRRGLHRDVCIPVLQHLRFSLYDLVAPELRDAAPSLPETEAWFRSTEIERLFSQLVAFIAQSSLPEQEDPAERCVHDAEKYIHAHYNDMEFSLAELLASLNVSKSYFSSAFKARTGRTFVEYLTAVRMDRAKFLLSSTSLCTYEIAEQTGFSDPHYFSVTFKRCVGLTPRDYREANP